MGKSSVQVIDHPHGKIAQIEGVIDGTFDLRPLLGDHEIVLIDLDGVSRITSFGVREWRSTLSQIKANYLCFVGCHPSILSQFNMVPGFACGGELISFYLPYICPDCNHVVEALLDLRGAGESQLSLEPPELRCPECHAQMEFDDLPAAYFKYARSVPSPRPPAAANTMIDERAPDLGQREFTIKKEVEDTVTAYWMAGVLDDPRSLRRLTEGVEGDVVLELSDLDGVTDSGQTGLTRFLRELGETYLCRVPQAILDKIIDTLQREALTECHVLSVVASIECDDCGRRAQLTVDTARREALAAGDEVCPGCGAALSQSALAKDLDPVLAKLTLAEPPEAVRLYLENRVSSHTPGSGGSYSAPSQLLFGNYRILRRLGKGGMGEVMLARYVGVEKFEKLVVIKRISRDYLSNPTAIQEFQEEARITARLSHPNIVQIFDFSKFDDEYFFAMEYVNGIDLRQALGLCSAAGLHWPAALCMRVISDICAGLDAAHGYRTEDGVALPIYHRDISPENVIISVDGAVKLMDFGIAKAADSSVNTESGVFKGKHAYSAPEQLAAEPKTDHRVDIFAAGIVLFELFSLRRYLGDEPTMGKVFAASKLPPRQLTDERDEVPGNLQQIFERATDPDRDLRYQTAADFRDALEAVMKQGEYATNHDLAAWIRKVIALRRAEADAGTGREPNTPGLRGPKRPDQDTAVERSLTSKDPLPSASGAPALETDVGRRRPSSSDEDSR